MAGGCGGLEPRDREQHLRNTRGLSDILSDTCDKLLRLMITMESNRQVIWMYSTLNRGLRKVWTSLIAQG